MAVKIRLKRMGKIRTAIYRVVVMDSRTKRDGRAIEEIGKYDPNQEPSLIEIDTERANYWIGQGAQPTEAVAALLKHYTDGTLKVAEPKPSKRELYDAAIAAAGKTAQDTSGATTAKKKAAKKDEPKADEAKAEETKVEEAPAAEATEAAPVAEVPAEDAKADEAPAADAAEAKELPAGAAAPLEDGAAPEGYTIKGNADSGKYHEPGGRWYDATVAEFWFKTEADAQAAGFIKAGTKAEG